MKRSHSANLKPKARNSSLPKQTLTPLLKAIHSQDLKMTAYLLSQGHHRLISLEQPQPHTLATIKNSCQIVKLLFQYKVEPSSSEPLLQSLKHQCLKCISLYRASVNQCFQGMMPLEYAIRNCELATIKHMFSL
jgi:hypothetical protein